MQLLRIITFAFFLSNLLFLNSFLLFSQTPIKVSDKNKVMELETAENIHNVMVAAVMGGNPENFVIYRSTDAGVTWDSVFFYQGDATFLGSPDPVVACDSAGTFYVVVMRTAPVSNPNEFKAHLWVFKSTDDGLTWTQSSKPYTGNNKADFPQIVIDKTNNRMYLVHSVYQYPTNSSSWIQFTYSTNGTTWSSPVSFTAQYAPPPAYFHAAGPNLGLLPNNKICLSYGDYNFGQIYFSSSSNLGVTWQPKQIIPVDASTKFLITKIVSHPNFNHLGIISHKPHQTVAKVYYSTSTDGGTTWQTQVIGPNASLGEGLIDNAGTVHTIFNQDSAGYFQLSYRYSTDLGVTFSPAINLLSASLPHTPPVAPEYAGEYQSIILGNDNLLHITFIDWNDARKAKHLIVAPLLTSFADLPGMVNAPKVFPNPVKDRMTIDFDNKRLSSSFEVADMQGKVLLTGGLQNGPTVIAIASLPSAMYLLRVYCGNNIYVQKMVKE